jgi:hypothetical protein
VDDDADPNPLPQGKMRLRALFAALLPLPLMAAVAPRTEPATYSGHYTVGWEEQSLRVCGERGAWWVSNPGPVLKPYRELVEGEYGTIYVTVRAEVTGPGMFGHMGMFRRAVAIREVVEARAATRDDCRRRNEAE